MQLKTIHFSQPAAIICLWHGMEYGAEHYVYVSLYALSLSLLFSFIITGWKVMS